MEDSRNALFVEPGAYIMRYEKSDKTPKKIIFQEPYESMPSYRMHEISHRATRSEDRSNTHESKNASPFNLSALSPILSMFGGGGLGNVGDIMSSLNGGGLMNFVNSLMTNPNMMKNVIGLFNKKESNESSARHEIKKSDLEIKNYTKVE